MRRLVFAAIVLGSAGAAACQLFFDTDVLVANQDGGTSSSDGGSGSDAEPGGEDAAQPVDSGASAADAEIFDAAVNAPFFADDFARANGTAVGNGWIEKNDEAFELSQQTALKRGSTVRYRDNLVYRADTQPADVEVSVVFSLLPPQTTPPGSPQVHARIQPATVGTANTLDSYRVYVSEDSTTAATIARQRGSAYSVRLTEFTFPSAPLVPPGVFRLRLRVQGTNPVAIAAWMERKNGSGGFDIVGQAAIVDGSSSHLTLPGFVGFSGDTSSDRRYAYSRFEAALLK
ncbi:MAG: hypothetical protein JWP87_4185 [Labilithrix sp.]|nr:hypothetical protein [Labilithrix sp.]